MRTPNCQCIICGKPLYRRPSELTKVRYVACFQHRVEAQNLAGRTEKQNVAFALGRVKGTNNLEGIPKSEESNRKRSEAHKKWCAENPDKVKARGEKQHETYLKDPTKGQRQSEKLKKWCLENPDKVKAMGKKTRGIKHVGWKGGSSTLNKTIRLMVEYKKWVRAIKKRDGVCFICGVTEELEAHHIISLSILLIMYNIINREQARNCAALWDLLNGITVCIQCHYKIHWRKYEN